MDMIKENKGKLLFDGKFKIHNLYKKSFNFSSVTLYIATFQILATYFLQLTSGMKY